MALFSADQKIGSFPDRPYVITELRSDQLTVAFEWGSPLGYQVLLNKLASTEKTYWHSSTQSAFLSPLAGTRFKLILDQWSKITGQNEPQDASEFRAVLQKPGFFEAADFLSRPNMIEK